MRFLLKFCNGLSSNWLRHGPRCVCHKNNVWHRACLVSPSVSDTPQQRIPGASRSTARDSKFPAGPRETGYALLTDPRLISCRFRPGRYPQRPGLSPSLAVKNLAMPGGFLAEFARWPDRTVPPHWPHSLDSQPICNLETDCPAARMWRYNRNGVRRQPTHQCLPPFANRFTSRSPVLPQSPNERFFRRTG